MKLSIKCIFLACLFSFGVKGQNISEFFLYSYDHALFNPAAAGAENKHVFGANGQYYGVKYYNEPTYESYDGVLSYNGHFKKINSGIGLINRISGNDFLTISRTALSYNYKCKITEKNSVRIGIRPSLTKATYEDGEWFDPNSPNKKSSVKCDFDLGAWFDFSGFYAGISVNHLLENGFVYYSSQRMLTVVLGKKIKVPGIMKIDPSLALVKHGYTYLYLNNNFIIKDLFIIGGTLTHSLDGSEFFNLNFNTGVKIAKRVELVCHIYSRELNRPDRENRIKFFEGMVRVKI